MSGTSVARSMMLRDAAAQRRAQGADHSQRAAHNRPVSARPSAALNPAVRFTPSVSPGSTDQNFADVLAMTGLGYGTGYGAGYGAGGPGAGLSGLLADPRLAAAQRSRLPSAVQPSSGVGQPMPAIPSPAAASSRPDGPYSGAGASAPIGPIPYNDAIAAAAKKYDVSPSLVAAVIKAESGFDPKAVSKAGAKGLMQLMDATARNLGVKDPFDPIQNIDGGTKFLSGLMKRYNGNATLALAAYNAGEGAIEKYAGIPPFKETKDFVAGVMGHWRRYNEVFRS